MTQFLRLGKNSKVLVPIVSRCELCVNNLKVYPRTIGGEEVQFICCKEYGDRKILSDVKKCKGYSLRGDTWIMDTSKSEEEWKWELKGD